MAKFECTLNNQNISTDNLANLWAFLAKSRLENEEFSAKLKIKSPDADHFLIWAGKISMGGLVMIIKDFMGGDWGFCQCEDCVTIRDAEMRIFRGE